MEYEEFKKKEDMKQAERMRELELKGNRAYNAGLWDAVKWNPFKWWVFLLCMRQI